MPAKKPSKIFYGWWLVILTGLISGFGTMIIGQGASVLFKPIASDLGIDRSTTSVANGVSGLVQGACFALAGWLTVKYGPRWVVFSGTLAGRNRFNTDELCLVSHLVLPDLGYSSSNRHYAGTFNTD